MNINVEHITKTYGTNTVLHDLSLEIEKGCCTVFMAPSGYGKTTLLRIIMGLENADSGQVTGVPDRLSAVFQENRLCEDFNAMENVSMVLKKSKGHSADNPDIVKTALQETGLQEEDLRKPICELSGGMKRRVAIVRAVLAEGELLLMDEPFLGLDEKNKKLAINFVKNHTRGKTIIFVTHDENEAKELGDKVIDLTAV